MVTTSFEIAATPLRWILTTILPDPETAHESGQTTLTEFGLTDGAFGTHAILHVWLADAPVILFDHLVGNGDHGFQTHAA